MRTSVVLLGSTAAGMAVDCTLHLPPSAGSDYDYAPPFHYPTACLRRRGADFSQYRLYRADPDCHSNTDRIVNRPAGAHANGHANHPTADADFHATTNIHAGAAYRRADCYEHTTTAHTCPHTNLSPTPTLQPEPTPTPPPTRHPSPIDHLPGGTELGQQQPEQAAHILELPWIADGVEGDREEIAVTALIKCGRFAPSTFDALISNPQTKESVNPETGFALDRLCDLEATSPELWNDFMRKGWIQDGLTENESEIVQALYSMTFESLEHKESHRIWAAMINMPFLETVDRLDLSTVRALAQIDNGIGIGDRFVETMSHPKLGDGISEEDVRMIILMNVVREWKPVEAETLLLEPAKFGLIVEERAVEMPLAGEAMLTIVRYRAPETPTMDLLERAVRFNEEFVGAPFPTDWIILYFDDEDSGIGLAFHWTYVGLREEIEETGTSGWSNDAPYVLIHETAHYYWHGGQSWINEGAANFLVYVSKREWEGQEAATEYASWTSPQCHQLPNLTELEKLNTAPGDAHFACNYEFGVQLFVDLHDTLGEETFRAGFRDLYLKRQGDDPSDNCEGTLLNICHVAASFKSGVSEEVADQVDEILSRRYGPLP